MNARIRREWLTRGDFASISTPTRATLAIKCAELSDAELCRQAMPPSKLSLLGLVQHMAEVERTWFRRVIAGEDVPLIWSADGDFQIAYDATHASASEAFQAWTSEVERSRHIELTAASLDVTGHQESAGTKASLCAS